MKEENRKWEVRGRAKGRIYRKEQLDFQSLKKSISEMDDQDKVRIFKNQKWLQSMIK